MKTKLNTFFAFCACALFAQDLPPLPPGFQPSAIVTSTTSSATFVIAPPPPTNALPFNFWTRQSRGITAASIASKTNVLRFNIVSSTNVSFSFTNAEWNIVFTNWPATQHLHVVMINDGVSPITTMTNCFYRVTQYR